MCMEKNINKGHCLVCGVEVMGGAGFRRYIRGRGLRVLCVEHASGLMGYHRSEDLRADSIGTEKKTILAATSVGVEIETDADSRYDETYLRFRGTLERVGFVFESDCTVNTGEAPSPKMFGLATISAILRNNQDCLYMLDTPRTGAHTHVGIDDMEYLRRYYHSIFVPFSDWLASHSDAWLIENFGSTFRGYARRINASSDVWEHSNVVNMQHDHTIEFRLSRIAGYKQYMRVIKFWREVGCFINHYDFEKSADAATRKAAAKSAGLEIVGIATRYFGD